MRSHRPILLFAAGLAAVFALTGCAAATTSATAAALSTTRTAVKVAAIAAPAAPTGKAPALTTTGANWPAVTGSLITYGQWLLANPNPSLAAAVTVPGCAANDALDAELQSLAGQGAVVQPAAPIVTSIIGPTSIVGGEVTVDIRAVRGSEPIRYRAKTGSTTHMYADHASLPPTALRLTLIRGADARWRFCTVTDGQRPDADALSALL